MQIVWKALLREVTSLNLNKEDEAFALLNGIRSNAGSSQIHALSRLMSKMFNQNAFQFSPNKNCSLPADVLCDQHVAISSKTSCSLNTAV